MSTQVDKNRIFSLFSLVLHCLFFLPALQLRCNKISMKSSEEARFTLSLSYRVLFFKAVCDVDTINLYQHFTRDLLLLIQLYPLPNNVFVPNQRLLGGISLKVSRSSSEVNTIFKLSCVKILKIVLYLIRLSQKNIFSTSIKNTSNRKICVKILRNFLSPFQTEEVDSTTSLQIRSCTKQKMS